jgi:hypothetical protein
MVASDLYLPYRFHVAAAHAALTICLVLLVILHLQVFGPWVNGLALAIWSEFCF